MIEHIQDRIGEIHTRFGAQPAVPLGEPATPAAFTHMLQNAVSGPGTHGTHSSGVCTCGLRSSLSPVGGPGATLGTTGTGVITGPVPDAAGPYLGLFEQAGRRHGIDPSLLAAVAWTESAFRPDAVSSAGALGLMQIMPATAASLGVDPRDPAQAVDGAARYLRDQLDAFGGDVRLALAAYNAGPGAVSRHGGIPPFPETIAYVQKVMGRHAQLGGIQ